MALTNTQTTNFNTILCAAHNGDLALVECCRRRDGAITAVMCVVTYDGDGVCLTPLAEIVTGDALAMYDPIRPARPADFGEVRPESASLDRARRRS
jgi:uncharacterized protein DUF6117